MAHVLNFDQDRYGVNVVAIQDREAIDGKWRVLYRDNGTVIAENNDSSQRRVYAVREWTHINQCRATRME